MDEAVQRAYQGNIQFGGFLEKRLRLRAVLAHDVAVIAAGFDEKISVKIHFVREKRAVDRAEAGVARAAQPAGGSTSAR